ncbi:MAG: sigma-70 family RNA polymerase sigma factor [Gemmatimonadota bacterium]|jgi:RNA polymerase sigma-70 factor (ECF subfamily)
MADPTLPPDDELIERIRSGDPATLELLMTAHWSGLLQYAGRIVGEASDPQDVVQEAFIRFWTRRERWGSEGSVRALLFTLTRNAALDERRRSARSERVALSAEAPQAPPRPSEDAEASQLLRAASRAVSALPPKRQEVFRLSREQGLSYAEIAEVMGVSPQTVANQMSLALADLRGALAPFLEAPRMDSGSPSGTSDGSDW